MASFTSDLDLIVIMLLGTSRQCWQVAVPHLVESRRTCACGRGSSQYQEIPSRGTAPASEASHRNAGCQFPVKTDLCPLSSKWTWRCCGRCESDASCKYMGKEGQKPVTKCSRHIFELFRYIPQFRIIYANIFMQIYLCSETENLRKCVELLGADLLAFLMANPEVHQTYVVWLPKTLCCNHSWQMCSMVAVIMLKS